jgi:hypothetical protein
MSPGQSAAEDERVLLELLPADGSAAGRTKVLDQLAWLPERYADACRRLEEQGRVLSGHGLGEEICRDLTAVPLEFRAACGRPGAQVTVRQKAVTIPHAACDLTGVSLSYPGRGGATVPALAESIVNSAGFRLAVDPRTLDVTITVSDDDAGNA